VEWAKERKWDCLEEYCMKDTVLTHIISTEKQEIIIPLSWNRSNAFQAVCRHVYCKESHQHKELEFESRPLTTNKEYINASYNSFNG